MELGMEFTSEGVPNEEFFKEHLAKEDNQKCFDCGTPNPRWVSTNNGVYFIESCALKHKRFENENTMVKDIDNEQLSAEEQNIVSLGGNEQAATYFAQFGLDQSEVKRFNTKAADHYRCILESKAENIPFADVNDVLSEEFIRIGKEQILNIDVVRRKSVAASFKKTRDSIKQPVSQQVYIKEQGTAYLGFAMSYIQTAFKAAAPIIVEKSKVAGAIALEKSKSVSAVAYEKAQAQAIEAKKNYDASAPIDYESYQNAGLNKAGSVWDSLKENAKKYGKSEAQEQAEEEVEEEGPEEVVPTFNDGDVRTIDESSKESIFEGTMYHGEVLFVKKGEEDEGKWVQHGSGTQVWENDDLYNGQWQNGLRVGKGAMIWSDGRKYLGEWQNDLANGLGIQYWAEGKTYDGGWKDGVQDGLGYFINNSGIRRNGLWEHGSRKTWIGAVYEPRNSEAIDNQFKAVFEQMIEDKMEEQKNAE